MVEDFKRLWNLYEDAVKTWRWMDSIQRSMAGWGSDDVVFEHVRTLREWLFLRMCCRYDVLVKEYARLCKEVWWCVPRPWWDLGKVLGD